MQIFNNISEISQKYHITFNLLNKKHNINIINIFNGNITFVTKNDSYLLYIVGLYYRYVRKDYNKMKQYFLQSIELENSDAMESLGQKA